MRIGYSIGRALGRSIGYAIDGDGIVPPLPTSAVEYWHSELGASSSAAVGQIGGRTLPAVGSPTVAADGSFFNGKNVYKSTSAGNYWAGTGLAALVSAGQRPWFFSVGRVQSFVQIPTLWSIGEQQSVGGTYGFRHGGRGTSPNQYYEGFRGQNGSLQNADSAPGTGTTNPYTWELTGADATLGLVSVVNGAQVAILTNATTQATVGGAIDSARICSAGVATGNASLAFFLVCSAAPSAREIAALRAWSLSYWGV